MRPDGRRLKTVDPLFGIIPMIMKKRSESQVMTDIEIDYSLIKEYTKKKKKEGVNITFMNVLISAYLRMCALVPEINRFIVNKKTFSRTEFTVSFVTLREGEMRDDKMEALLKVKLNFTDSIFDVAKVVNEQIQKDRVPDSENGTDRLIKFFMGVPLIPSAVVRFVMWLDNFGLLPRMVIEGSPFHSTLFITNMASINMQGVYHHLYEFGTNSTFLAIGKLSSNPTSHNPKRKTMKVRGVVDERICAGATFSKAHAVFQKYLQDPSLLETPLKPEEVINDID